MDCQKRVSKPPFALSTRTTLFTFKFSRIRIPEDKINLPTSSRVLNGRFEARYCSFDIECDFVHIITNNSEGLETVLTSFKTCPSYISMEDGRNFHSFVHFCNFCRFVTSDSTLPVTALPTWQPSLQNSMAMLAFGLTLKFTAQIDYSARPLRYAYWSFQPSSRLSWAV